MRAQTELTVRPHVIVYVTREHPETGADEFLVFDVPRRARVHRRRARRRHRGGRDDRGRGGARGDERRPGSTSGVVRTLGWPSIPDCVSRTTSIRATSSRRRPASACPSEWEHHITGDGVEAGSVRPLRLAPGAGGRRGLGVPRRISSTTSCASAWSDTSRAAASSSSSTTAGTTQLPAGRIDHARDLRGRPRPRGRGGDGPHRRARRRRAGRCRQSSTRLFGPGAHESHASSMP